MTDQEIQDIVNRVIGALHGLAPLPPSEPTGLMLIPVFAPVAALIAAGLVTFVGWRNLKHQQFALKTSVRSDARNLSQKRLADARSEWWKRTQWALEAAASKTEPMYSYGTGMLDLLAQSDLAGPEDKALLDAVWEGTSTEMQDADIKLLIQEASEQEDLSYEELVSLISYDESSLPVLEQLLSSSQGVKLETLQRLLRHLGVSDDEAPAAPVDDSPLDGDNGGDKEDGND